MDPKQSRICFYRLLPAIPRLSLIPWIIPMILLVIWELICRNGLLPEYLLPSPGTVGKGVFNYVLGGGMEPYGYAGRFWSDLGASLSRVGAGFGLAVLSGVPLGICSGRQQIVQRLFSNLVTGLRSVPGISWLPLALVWFGIGFKTSVFLIGLAAFFPIYLNSLSGAASVPFHLIRVGEMLGLSRLGLVLKVVIPCAYLQIVTGLRLGLGISFAYLVLGELTGVPNGIGAFIMDARMMGRVDLVVIGIVVLSVVGAVADRLLVNGLGLIFPFRSESDKIG